MRWTKLAFGMRLHWQSKIGVLGWYSSELMVDIWLFIVEYLPSQIFVCWLFSCEWTDGQQTCRTSSAIASQSFQFPGCLILLTLDMFICRYSFVALWPLHRTDFGNTIELLLDDFSHIHFCNIQSCLHSHLVCKSACFKIPPTMTEVGVMNHCFERWWSYIVILYKQ